METHLLFLCLLGCTRLVLVFGHPTDQRRDTEGLQKFLPGIRKTLDRVVDLGQDAAEQRAELSALINDDSEGARPDINPYGVEDEEVNNNSNSTNETTSATTSYVTVDITPTATTSATGNSSTIANCTTSVPTILPTATVNRTSTRGPATASVSSANTSMHLATSTSAPASVPVASSTFVTASISSATSTSVTASVTSTSAPASVPMGSSTFVTASISLATSTSVTASVTSTSVSASVPMGSSTPSPASVPVTTSVPNTPTPSSSSSNEVPTSSSTSSTDGIPSTTNTPTTKPAKLNIPLIAGCAAGGAFVVLLICCVLTIFICVRKRRKGPYTRLRNRITPEDEDDRASQMSDILDSIRDDDDSDTNMLTFSNAEGDDYDKCFRSFMEQHPEYRSRKQQQMDLGSRMQKHWYQVEMKGNGQEKKILTIAPVSQHCPLKLHKHQKGLNKLLRVLKEHPYLHSIELVEYLSDYELLVMVQSLRKAGSLKDIIYKANPLTNWSDKYAHRSSGLPPEKIARYGRQILEAIKFLYSKGFPTLGHIQSGNIFVVNDVCHLGGYENTLLGYKTRLFRLCKDHLQHFDVILFGHVVFEMAAGYELTHLRPSEVDYKNVNKSVKLILEHIFEEEFPNDINKISSHDFFRGSPSELSDFDPNQVQLTDSMNKVLKKVRKGKVRVQKSTKPKEAKPNDGGSTLTAKFKTTFRGIKLGGKSSSKNVGDVDPRPLLDTAD